MEPVNQNLKPESGFAFQLNAPLEENDERYWFEIAEIQ